MKQLTTYSDYKKEIEKIKKELISQEDECAKKGLSFDEMIEETKELRYKISEYSRKLAKIILFP